jgi:glyoxylase-like metal-dependent hydrolase (beta-lactamase superfamily II)
LSDTDTGDCVVVDPGGEVERIGRYLEERSLRVKAIFLTHAHIDHAGGIVALMEYLEKSNSVKPPLYSENEFEIEMRGSISRQAAMFGLPEGEYQNAPEPDVVVKDGDLLDVGSFRGRVIHTPGHSPGHLALYFDSLTFVRSVSPIEGQISSDVTETGSVLLAGDTLFAGSIGRCDLPGGDEATLLSSIREKLFILPDETRVMPGHGPDTSIAIEKRENPYLRSE